MCGIAGFVTAETSKARLERIKFLQQALALNTLRGDDSTGMFYVPHNAKVGLTPGWMKDVTDGYAFTKSEEFLKITNKIDDMSFVVTHNRAATVGKVSAETAHPFQEGPITFVHNGTLDTTYGLPKAMFELNKGKKYDDKSLVEVDSHAICHNLATEDLSEVIERIQGAFAMVWYDSRETSLFMIRNDRRPLHITQDKDSNTVYFMSEAEMLDLICRRNNIRRGEIYQPEPGSLIRFPVGKLKPTIKKLKLYTPVIYQGCHNQGGIHAPFSPADTRGTTSPLAEKIIQRMRARHTKTGTSTDLDADTVFVGGKRRPIPEPSQEMLLEENLVVEDRFLMRPIEFYPYLHNKQFGFVLGQANARGVGSITCLIHACEAALWQTLNKNLWAVRPVAIRRQSLGDFLVVCRPVRVHTQEARRVVEEIVLKEAELDRKSIVSSDTNLTACVPGPAGALISIDAFRKLAEGGCYHCGKLVMPAHASSIIWVADNTRPVCRACQSDWVTINESLSK